MCPTEESEYNTHGPGFYALNGTFRTEKCDCVSCLGHRKTIVPAVVLQAKSLKEVPVPALLVKICHLSTWGPWRYRLLTYSSVTESGW